MYVFRVSHVLFNLPEAPSCLVRDVMEIYKNNEYKKKTSTDTESSVEISRAMEAEYDVVKQGCPTRGSLPLF